MRRRAQRGWWCMAGVLLFTCGRLFAGGESLPATDEPWHHYRSPNFELYASGNEKEARTMLWNLELLRAVFFERFKLTERSKLDVTVYHFRKLDHFWAYGPPGYNPASRVRAFYLPHPDRALISIGPTDTAEAAQHIVFHEYVHHLFRTTDQQPTTWFNEGVAELLATLRIVKGKIEIGHGSRGNLFMLQSQPLLPLETLFGVDRRSPIYRGHDKQGMFYAQSWALLHYLHFGETKLERDGVNRFVRVMGDAKAASATDHARLFQECLGMDYEEMKRRLDRYVVNGKYRYGIQEVPAIPEAGSYAVRPVAPDEARARLGELALRVSKSAAGKLALLDAVAAQTKDPRVYETLGTAAALFEKDVNGARERWEQALELGSDNIAVHRELGLLESRQWFQKFDYDFRLPKETATRLRTRLLRSIQAVPAQSAAYEMLALVEAFSEEPVIANVNLVQEHFRQLKEKQRTLVALALVRVRVDRPQEAKDLLRQLDELPPDPAVAKIAQAVAGHIDAALQRAQSTARLGPGTSP